MVPDYPELHKEFHDWVDTVIDKALNLRKETPSYLLDIIAENINSSNNLFSRPLKRLLSTVIQ